MKHSSKTEDIIEDWPMWMNTLKNQAQVLSRAIVYCMNAPRKSDKFPVDAGDFISRVMPYETRPNETNLGLASWHRALYDLTDKKEWSSTHITTILHFHSFLKDPIGGLYNSFGIYKD
jgi:hypothetical protein